MGAYGFESRTEYTKIVGKQRYLESNAANLSDGVKVAQQFLVLLVQVRILVGHQ